MRAMNPILRGGVVLGALVAVWIFVTGFTGWYKDPSTAPRFIAVATLIEVVVLIWTLRRTAAEGRTYSGQVVAGTLSAIVGGVLVICASLLFTTVFFKDAMEAIQPPQSPMQNALAGFMGTFITGVVASAIIAVWVRARGPRPVRT